MPNLFAGPVPPTSRWLCPPFEPNWTFVGASVFTDLEYTPRRCIAMHPTYESTTTIELPARPIGKKVVAYVGLHVFLEREKIRAPIFARISVSGKEVAIARHRDGDGWLRFEGSTAEYAGTSQPVKIESWAEGGRTELRFMCVAAQLRD